eukprot:154895-Hanusia_phi.AAC.1
MAARALGQWWLPGRAPSLIGHPMIAHQRRAMIAGLADSGTRESLTVIGPPPPPGPAVTWFRASSRADSTRLSLPESPSDPSGQPGPRRRTVWHRH